MNRKPLIAITALSLLLGEARLALAEDAATAPAQSTTFGAAISDTAITAQVKAKFLSDTRLKDTSISVTTANGVVTLTGNSPTADGKTAAEDLARHVDGVKDVDNQVTAPTLGTLLTNDAKTVANKTSRIVTDSWITTKVKSALLADSLTKGSKITVTTSKHIVRLGGSADTQATADKAITIAKQVEGVEHVDASAVRIGSD